jgi:hypothetical protein
MEAADNENAESRNASGSVALLLRITF